MTSKDPREIGAALAAPFAPEDLEWRLQMTLEDKMRGLAVPYVTNRAIQSRLDEVVGTENWHNEYKPWHSSGKKESQICGISIYFEDRGWVTKWDGAEDTDIEPIKGGLSDSMKRSAVHWGIGRVLYNMDTVWVGVEKRGRSIVIVDSERPKLDSAYLAMLKKLKLSPGVPTGAQAQLTPTAPKGGEQKTSTEQAPKSENTIPMPTRQQPSPEYTVQNIKIQKGMRGDTTSLTLVGIDGKQTPVFARGALELCDGAMLCNVKLDTKTQGNVVYTVLESFEVVPFTQAA